MGTGEGEGSVGPSGRPGKEGSPSERPGEAGSPREGARQRTPGPDRVGSSGPHGRSFPGKGPAVPVPGGRSAGQASAGRAAGSSECGGTEAVHAGAVCSARTKTRISAGGRAQTNLPCSRGRGVFTSLQGPSGAGASASARERDEAGGARAGGCAALGDSQTSLQGPSGAGGLERRPRGGPPACTCRPRGEHR